MYSRQKRLEIPKQFGFPFPPYNIQADMMKEVYEVLENRQIGIFESPTGTGKSLTLTCAVLRWLLDNEKLVSDEIAMRICEEKKALSTLNGICSQEVDWIKSQSHIISKNRELLDLKAKQAEILQCSLELKSIRIQQKLSLNSKPSTDPNKEKKNKLDELHHTDYDANNYAEDLLKEEQLYSDDLFFPKSCHVRVYYCSRTHTQLAQVVEEIRRTEYGQKVSCISLGSRQQLCVNPDVKKLGSLVHINERCLEMTKKKSVGTNNCKKICSFRCSSKVMELRNYALSEILDIENLAAAGEEKQACPYYASRESIQLAQVIMLPYQMLLNKKTRSEIGINLTDSIIIIDEAHNLLDSIAQIYSCQVTLEQLQSIQQQIISYKMKYGKQFSSKNLLQINKLLYTVKRLNGLIRKTAEMDKTTMKPTIKVLQTYELMAEADFFNLNLIEILLFCKLTKFPIKLQGFVRNCYYKNLQNNGNDSKQSDNVNAENIPSSTKNLLKSLEARNASKRDVTKVQKNEQTNTFSNTSLNNENVEQKFNTVLNGAIFSLISFLEAFANRTEDGRILLTGSSLKYLVLNPGSHFQDIISDARSIIIAGGTMKPTDDLMQQLFFGCPERVRVHCYNHVVPDGAVLPFAITKGPSGHTLNFNFQHRFMKETLNELTMILENLCEIIPGGLVCFLPSYDYLDVVYGHLNSVGLDRLEKIKQLKEIFLEPSAVHRRRGKELSTDEVLTQYAKAIRSKTTTKKNGALLLGVVGGKLSEGLNFADDLGRGIIVVGLPYANPNCCELKERMNFLEKKLGVGSGKDYYENNCWKLINQCIGRSVRHINDYACVYLLDDRYQRPELRTKLPQWISRHLHLTSRFEEVDNKTKEFFLKRNVK